MSLSLAPGMGRTKVGLAVSTLTSRMMESPIMRAIGEGVWPKEEEAGEKDSW